MFAAPSAGGRIRDRIATDRHLGSADVVVPAPTNTTSGARSPGALAASGDYLLDTARCIVGARRGRSSGRNGPRLPHPLYTCEPVLTEAAHFLGDAGPVLTAVGDGLLVCPWNLCDHEARVRELVRKYADRRMDLADACLEAMSEKW
jgi:hypothetical protein